MRYSTLLLLLCLLVASSHARTLHIGAGGYASLEAAARDALPGDTIRFSSGVHAGGSYVANLRGTADKWILITGPDNGIAVIEGGGTAFQLTDPAYLHIRNLNFRGQSANGVNIDDGGSYDSPARHLLIEQCVWEGINATGNNDLLKMSGVDSFVVRNCAFLDGSPGGSMVDMVGCHWGVFEDNLFRNGGSNSIQAKGGTSDILITHNRFLNGGARALNIGGSTGLDFFRPMNADYEGARILVFANYFRGGQAPFAFVGAVQCDVMNNTVVYPEKWVMRILQENTDARFQQCGDNRFRNNLVVVDNRAISPSVNIGPNTRPATFVFEHNLWFNTQQPSWQGPQLPSTEIAGLRALDPRLRDLATDDIALLSDSPAIGAGLPFAAMLRDLFGALFNVPPSIGAVEGNPPVSALEEAHNTALPALFVYPQPAREQVTLRLTAPSRAAQSVELCDMSGRVLRRALLPAGTMVHALDLRTLPAGRYVLLLRGGVNTSRSVLVLR